MDNVIPFSHKARTRDVIARPSHWSIAERVKLICLQSKRAADIPKIRFESQTHFLQGRLDDWEFQHTRRPNLLPRFAVAGNILKLTTRVARRGALKGKGGEPIWRFDDILMRSLQRKQGVRIAFEFPVCMVGLKPSQSKQSQAQPTEPPDMGGLRSQRKPNRTKAAKRLIINIITLIVVVCHQLSMQIACSSCVARVYHNACDGGQSTR